MAARVPIAFALSAGLLLATGSLLGAGEKKPTPRLITKVYPVADLIVPLDDAGNTVVTLSANGGAATALPAPPPAPATACPRTSEWITPTSGVTRASVAAGIEHRASPPAAPAPGARTVGVRIKSPQTTEDTLIKLVSASIAPQSWSDRGGEGTIQYYPLGMAVIVTQTADVQAQIGELFHALRRQQDNQVSLEVRFVTVTDKFFARVAQDLGFEPKLCNAGPKGECCSSGVAFLNDREVMKLMDALQGSPRTNVMQTPKITVFNGTESNLNINDQQYFVTEVHVLQAGGQTVFVPENKPIRTGFNLAVRPVVSADRRYVNVNLNADQTSISKVDLFPISTFITPVFEGGAVGQPIPFTQFVQQPKLTNVSVHKSFSVPDGGTMLLSGWKSLNGLGREEKTLIAEILDTLCPPPPSAKENEMVIVMVTPRIIVAEEDEIRLGKAAPPLSNRVLISEEEEVKPVPGLGPVEEKAVPKLISVVPPPPVSGRKAVSVLDILASYQQACADGRLADAANLAKKALTIDPACFSQYAPRKEQEKSGSR